MEHSAAAESSQRAGAQHKFLGAYTTRERLNQNVTRNVVWKTLVHDEPDQEVCAVKQ